MRHPKRTITREIRARRPRHPGRSTDQLAAETWPESRRVGDCTSKGVRKAARLMRERKVGALPVVRGDTVVGVVTEMDLLNELARALGDGVAKSFRWAFAR